VEPLVFVYYLCNTKKHVQVGGLNGEKDVEALRKKLNCSELSYTSLQACNYFCYDNRLWIPMFRECSWTWHV